MDKYFSDKCKFRRLANTTANFIDRFRHPRKRLSFGGCSAFYIHRQCSPDKWKHECMNTFILPIPEPIP